MHVTHCPYIPIDISRNHLVTNARLIFKDYSNLNVYPVCADYTKPLEIPVKNTHHNLVGYFPGSSIGNFEPSDARLFLRRVRDTVRFQWKITDRSRYQKIYKYAQRRL